MDYDDDGVVWKFFSSNGSLDSSFGVGGKQIYDNIANSNATYLDDRIYTVVFDPGKNATLIGGWLSYNENSNCSVYNWDGFVMRIFSDGSEDNSFGSSGLVRIDEGEGEDSFHQQVTKIKILSSGAYLIGGYKKNCTSPQIHASWWILAP